MQYRTVAGIIFEKSQKTEKIDVNRHFHLADFTDFILLFCCVLFIYLFFKQI